MKLNNCASDACRTDWSDPQDQATFWRPHPPIIDRKIVTVGSFLITLSRATVDGSLNCKRSSADCKKFHQISDNSLPSSGLVQGHIITAL